MPFPRVRGCRRKQRKALCGSTSVPGKPWSGVPPINFPIYTTQDTVLTCPENRSASLSLTIPDVPLAAATTPINPMDDAPKPYNNANFTLLNDGRAMHQPDGFGDSLVLMMGCGTLGAGFNGLADYWTPDDTKAIIPAGSDNDPLAKEDLMPTMSDIHQSTVLDWGTMWVGFVPIPVVEHVWLTLKVTATDNAAIDRVKFVFKDSGLAQNDYEGEAGNWYSATFDIDFWCDYTAGYEVEVSAYDVAGNTMAKTAAVPALDTDAPLRFSCDT
jgi:hypothetical protein